MFCANCGSQVQDGADACPKCGVSLGGKGKTKLGISIGLFGAALYFTGFINIIALFLMVGYVLLFESNDWLKKTAVKVVVITILFSIAYELIGSLNSVFSFINVILGWFKVEFRLDYPVNLDGLISFALNFIQSVILLASGFKALKKESVNIKYIDSIVEKHM